ncbi:PhlD [Streptomyces olivoreticuli]
MPASYISRPAIELPTHKITTEEIYDNIRTRHPDHPRLRAIERVVQATTVRNRHFTRPLDSPLVSGTAPLKERVKAAFSDALAMATDAAQKALDTAGLHPADIDAVITSHTTSWGVPHMDVQLVNALGLKPDVRHLSMTTLACAGGAQSLIRASEFVAARPGSRVLVVVTEVISSVYNHQDTGIESMIYKALFGDSAGACIVTDTPLGPGLRIDDTWEYILPGSMDRYSGRLDHDGLHFDSTREALNAADDVLPPLLDWLGSWRPDIPVIHPGGPRIIEDVARGLDLPDTAARHSWNSLAENGNLGGVAVLDVLRRTHEDPPTDGNALLIAFGPGFAASGCRGTWSS